MFNKMKNVIGVLPLIVMFLVILLLGSCKKDDNKSKLTDADGNIYSTVTIGTQIWMVENLKTTKYSNGDSIPNITLNTKWAFPTGAYCDFNNTPSNSSIYGRLYNWYAVTDSRSLCPTGWHIPTDNEWTTLITYLRGDSVAGGKMKETDTNHWQSPNTGATNETGFTALPGGYRDYGGAYYSVRKYGCWWSSSEYSASGAFYRSMCFGYSDIMRDPNYKAYGLSVRCLMD